MSTGTITWASAQQTATAHWLPVKVSKDCALSTDELASLIQDQGAVGEEQTVALGPCATLRGRQLRGLQYDLPDGYVVLSLAQQKAPQELLPASTSSAFQPYHDWHGNDDDDDDCGDDHEGRSGGLPPQNKKKGEGASGKHWAAASCAHSITLWGHDVAPGKADPARKTLDYLSVAGAVHAAVSREQVLQQMSALQGSR